MKLVKHIMMTLVLLIQVMYLTQAQELNTILMNSTFKIEGPSNEVSGITTGTVFILGKPSLKKAGFAYYVLVTACHVFDKISGDNAVLYLRVKESSNNYSKLPINVRIRQNGKDLWTRHPDKNIDVAVMYIKLPKNVEIPLLITDFLATDSTFIKYEIHPGDELCCLGYPEGFESNTAGFPILRSGKISSYPLVPFKSVKRFYYDFKVFGGNSGGPVYFTQLGRPFGGTYHLEQSVQFIAGLVSKQIEIKESVNMKYESKQSIYPLELAEVVPAVFIKEAIEKLPKME